MDFDVLIVGAGPTGLMLANQLARRGVRAMIIDRHAGPARETRALGVQARTLEIYSHLGLATRAVEMGKRGTGAYLWARGRKMAHVPLGEAGKHVTPYPYILVLGQDDNERLLGEKLTEYGSSVQWNTELISLDQHSDHVEVKLKGSDGAQRTLRAAWVAGCDGAHSAVRELNHIEFPGAPYEHVFFVADVEATGGMVPDTVNAYLWRDGFHLMFPMRGVDHWRLVGILPQALRGRKDVTFEDVVPSVRIELGATLTFKSCAWFSTYRIHHRAAARFRQGRCFVLGDAAHIHSPVGAQGMNTGLQDAYNLGWKLALVVAKQADESLLDSYHDERWPIAQRLLHTTDRGFRLVVSDSWLAGLMRTEVLARVAAFAMGRERIQRIAFRTVSQTGIHYRDSALSSGNVPDDAPQAGDRFPWLKLRWRGDGAIEDTFQALDDTKFNLVIFGEGPAPGGPASEGSSLIPADLLRGHVVPRDADNDAELTRHKIPRPSCYLIRPDGHVGFCSDRFDAAAIDRYLTTRLRFLQPAPSRVRATASSFPAAGPSA
jgi:2-polyprenyl-6-methoxyphenol hydroxylase-like FAD-dependent oxidoreductase